MKNNKGFSMVELIVSFAICSVIVVFLFQIVLVLKDLYEKSAIKTTLLNRQNIITNLIYIDVLEKELETVQSCDNDTYCVRFKFKDNSAKILSYSSNDNKMSYGDYTTEVLGGSTVENFEFSINSGVFYVRVPITHKLFNNEKFDIRIVHYQST